MWKRPWTYLEGAVIGAGLVATGEILQLSVGEVAWNLFAYPLNVLLAAVFVSAIILAFVVRKRVYFFRWCATVQAAIPIMVWCAVLTLVMGLSGWMSMLRWWPLVLCYTFMMFVLGMTCLKRLRPFSFAFMLNHGGLFVALLAGTLGNADVQKLRMEVRVGRPEWRAIDESDNSIKELELAVELHSFTIDEYPAKLMLVDNETGKAVPAGKPEQIVIEGSVTGGMLMDWEIEADSCMEMAAQVTDGENKVKYVEWKNMGATTAAHVTAKQRETGEMKEGWVSCGSFMFPYHALKLDERYSLVMPEREPKRFASDVTVYTKAGTVKDAVIEVNKPLEIDGWKIYQLSYDETMGRWSDTSVFELVRDPWLGWVYAGIFMMLGGAICMFVSAGRKGSEQKETLKTSESC
ncbi:MAG: cytochrome c biogenesis protein ResB [Bacteroidaceae bacterium]|nr:cytochrome c biogenesis protein ResB [Bacteroidaceae bacterium]